MKTLIVTSIFDTGNFVLDAGIIPFIIISALLWFISALLWFIVIIKERWLQKFVHRSQVKLACQSLQGRKQGMDTTAR